MDRRATGIDSLEDDQNVERIDLEDYEATEGSPGIRMYKNLSPAERLILKVQLDVPAESVRFLGLYRYATKRDKIIVSASSICAICGGVAMPLMTIVVGTIAGDFQNFFLAKTDGSSLRHALGQKSLYFVYLAIGEFFLIYAATTGFVYSGEVIASRVRRLYLKAVLRQNAAFFDHLGTGEIVVHLTADANHLQDGISEKVAVTLTALGTFNSAFVICFIKYWKLTLICLSTVVAIFLTVNIGALFLVKFKKLSFEAYAVGGSVVEESLTSMANATAFGIQDRLARLYYENLLAAGNLGMKFKHVLAVMIGLIVCLNFLNYGLALWMGSRFLVDGDVSLSQILTIVLAVTIATFSLGQIGPNFEAFTTAIAAASKIYAHIDRLSAMDPLSDEGGSLREVNGEITLRDIKLVYPSRSKTVLESFDLTIPAGQTTALVGSSGSGKSSIVSLIERFYDPIRGEVQLDGCPINTLNLSWLRQQMSLVQQEPVLFDGTIFKNIEIGLLGSRFQHESKGQTADRIIEAAKTANAHNFIMGLPAGYQTHVASSSLSGGEKQRIAIARAIVKDPKILLLDEPTSALDAESERVVQGALERAAENRTTLIIAHRLSTVRTADNIVVMRQGQIVEQGTHLNLMENRDLYFDVVNAQRNGYLKTESVARSDATTLVGKPRTSTVGTPTTIASFDDALSYLNSESPMVHDLETYDYQRIPLFSEGDSEIHLETSSAYSWWDLAKFTASFNKDDKPLIAAGLLASIVAGGGQPTQAVFFAKGIETLALPLSMRHKIRSDIDFWCWMYFMLALVQLLALLLQGFAFAFCSERLIRRARDRAFRTILRQEIDFFEKSEHSSGTLTAFLATEISHLAGLSGVTLGTILTCITTIIAAVTVSLAIGWKLALVTTTTVPITLGCGFFRVWALTRFQLIAQKAYTRSAAFASEHISAIRTVASLTMERDVHSRYQDMLSAQEQNSLSSNLKNSALYAATQSLTPLCIALGFWYGGTLISHREYSLFQFFVCLIQIIFSVQSAGTVFSFAADIAKAKNAASQLKQLFEHRPRIDTWSIKGDKIVPQHLDTIEFANVHFRYRNRPNVPILQGLNLALRRGQFVGLVGASGSGKSTIISLLERFYDPSHGSVRLGGRDIRDFNVNDYRSYLALVSQEPVLYQGTIEENLRLGVDRDVSDDSLIRVCKEANIYDFITSLPDGFATPCGSKAALLSTGQKQRIAIARALLRDPQILLLDEATSALDSESEKLVQNALSLARRGKTTIAIAHRLSSIQHADMICVIEGGVITEKGTHNELMARRSKYRDLVGLQNLGVQA